MKEQLISELKNKNIPHCFNECEYDYEKLEFIIVGDNPGKEEMCKKQYFVGTSGKSLRSFFTDNIIERKEFNDFCIVFNKTFIHTEKTNQLKEIRAKDIELFDKTQEYCANEIIELANKNNIPVLVFGKTQLKPKGMFKPFWNELNKSIKNKENIFVFNHPSYNNFNKEWNKYKGQNPELVNKDLLEKLGKENTKKINQLYIKRPLLIINRIWKNLCLFIKKIKVYLRK